jgi:hypothetical protein
MLEKTEGKSGMDIPETDNNGHKTHKKHNTNN